MRHRAMPQQMQQSLAAQRLMQLLHSWLQPNLLRQSCPAILRVQQPLRQPWRMRSRPRSRQGSRQLLQQSQLSCPVVFLRPLTSHLL